MSKRHYSVVYFISQTVKGLLRNAVMTIASVLVLISMLAVMGGFWLLVVNIDENLNHLEVMNDIVIMMDSEASEEDIQKTEEALNQMKQFGLGLNAETGGYDILDDTFSGNAAEHVELGIESIEHVTKQQALEQMKSSDPDLYSDINDENNPLPDKFVLKYNDASKVETISTAVWSINQRLSGEMIKTVKGYEQLVNTVTSLRKGVMYVLTWFLIVLAVVSVFIIINTVKLSVYSRRQEIMIMRYVGASKWFITLPFLGEGVLIGAVSAVAAFFIEKFAYQGVTHLLTNSDSGMILQLISITPFGSMQVKILLGFLCIGIAAGVIGSSISLSKYAKT